MFFIDHDDSAWYGCLATQHYLGPVGFKALVDACGSARAVYAASSEALKAIHPQLRDKMVESLARGPDLKAWEEVVRGCDRSGIAVTAPAWGGFPEALNSLDAPPPLLFLQGAWRPEDARAVALVGTRAPTDYGREAAFTLARDLCAKGFTVVSGLAVGIDASAHAGALSYRSAHAGALEAGGRTLAVIGCGLDIDYPRENRELRDRIAQSGAVISEHPPGTQPQQMHFPRRNRLISALSRAIVVVEAGEKSGALITADEGRRQGRVLFAVPGSLFNPAARGSHALLRAGAALAASADDVAAVLDEGMSGGPAGKAPRSLPRPAQPALPKAEIPKRPAAKMAAKTPVKSPARLVRPSPRQEQESEDPVLRLWFGDEACGLDALAARAVAANLWPAERAPGALIEALLVLEMHGRVERLPGPSYRRTGSR